ncbi:hypothetical protein [Flavobacterium silvaticum]|uniref:Repeat protein (TIGR03806 family) n=1 Tax=Flavobacterium silvaticum TaxID=1852020 RepID=A0A972FRC2_9FLAO|nr:hypothetical protein [Flavobacterium silvaticum]NMH27949.1 hypothetical protein [Flavobacterium silvaticum]
MKLLLRNLSVLAFLFLIVSCSKDDHDEYIEPEVIDPVTVDLSLVPYPKLSDYHFFDGEMNLLHPSVRLIPYQPSSQLFTDYASKARFLWIPEGTSAQYVSDSEPFEMPVGSVLIKNFFYSDTPNGRQLVETRLMIRKADGWIFANYIWNDEQTEAFYSTSDEIKTITFTQNSTTRTIDYRIPSQNDCATCHNQNEVARPLGFKPQNLNNFIGYYPDDFDSNQLEYLSGHGIATGIPSNVVSTVDYSDASQPLDLRVRSYFDSNCAHCHSDGGTASYTVLRFGFNVTSDPSQMGVCVGATLEPPGFDHVKIVNPQNASGSTLPFMMSTDISFYMMPRIGRTIVHEEAVEMVNQWISSLPECE